MKTPLRIGIIAGEMSGDILGAGLIRAIKAEHPDTIFEGVGGPKMIAEGCISLADQERLAVMGYVEPLKRLPELLAIRRRLKQHFLQNPPDVFIGVDYVVFNIGFETMLKKAGIKTVHYVSPSVWAWRQGRVKKIAKAVDLILTLFPFEAKFYEDHQVPVSFVGHTLADEIPLQTDTQAARAQLKLSGDSAQRIIALLPGSRNSEVALLATDFFAAARLCLQAEPGLQFVVPAANAQRHAQLTDILKNFPDLPVTLLEGQSHLAMAAADAVLMASGTTTLEAMLLKKPMVVAYRFPALSYAIISRLIKIPYVSLPNILAGSFLVPELLQNAATPQALSAALLHWLKNPAAVSELQQQFLTLHQSLKQNADHRAAQAVLALIDKVQ